MRVMLANRPASLPAEPKRQTACKNVNIILFFKYRLFHSRPSCLRLSTSVPSSDLAGLLAQIQPLCRSRSAPAPHISVSWTGARLPSLERAAAAAAAAEGRWRSPAAAAVAVAALARARAPSARAGETRPTRWARTCRGAGLTLGEPWGGLEGMESGLLWPQGFSWGLQALGAAEGAAEGGLGAPGSRGVYIRP